MRSCQFIHGLSFWSIKFSFFLGVKVKCQCGVRGTSFPKRPQVDGRLLTHAKLEIMIDLWEDKHCE
jgi:hypothetical protein